MIAFFVTGSSHEFSFVIQATIDLARKILPNVNQFFESLYIPTRNQKSPGSLVDYPFGWTTAIEEFCQSTSHHPNCANPISRSFIEREFVAWTINNPDRFKSLDDYINAIYNKSIGRDLQWLYSSIAPVKDNIHDCLEISNLYTQVDKQQGQIFHTKKGLRITIPEERWINW